MKQKVARKLVLEYHPSAGGKAQTLQMGFMGEGIGFHSSKVRVYPPISEDEPGTHTFNLTHAETIEEYNKHLEDVCGALNKELVKLVDYASFHIVVSKRIDPCKEAEE